MSLDNPGPNRNFNTFGSR